MSETITEMVLPGTYIEVRSEGLIGVSGIATGNLGVVGTAASGTVGEVVLLSTYAEALETFGAYDAWDPDPAADPRPLTLTRTLEQLFRGGASTVYAVRIAGTDLRPARWDLEAKTGGATVFSLLARRPGVWANGIEVEVAVDSASLHTLTLSLGKLKEVHTGANAGALFTAVNAGSALVSAVKMPTPPATGEPSPTLPEPDTTKALKIGIAPKAVEGADGANAGPTNAATALAHLETKAVHILVVGGMNASEVGPQVRGHLEHTENDGRERIAVLGTRTAKAADIASDLSKDSASPLPSSARIILVAPGIIAADAASGGDANVELPPSYAAALVAGRLSTLAPHVSPTNKDVAAAGLTVLYNRGQQKDLVANNILVLHQNLGLRILKGISSEPGAFQQITTRRIVDYAKAGVRIGANPYIGKLNNARVRGALQATLDGFLSGMVLDEMLTSYDLAVTATRPQEVAGVALVEMTLRPTFSIDFIKVIMNLS